MVTAYLGIGSNMGERLATLRMARQQLAETPGIRNLAASPLYATEPIGGPPGQGPYLNAVMRLQTSLEPEALWRRCQQLERAAGRERSVPNAPRTLDLDLLLYGDRRLGTDTLTIPHPRLHERRFVLAPLCDLAPQQLHPVLGVSMLQLLRDLEGNGVERLREDW